MHNPRLLHSLSIFLVAIAFRILLGFVQGAFERQPSGEMYAVAHSIATTGVFGNPNGIPSGPTAFVAPLYPYVLAALQLTMPDQIIAPVLATVSIVLASLLWALLPMVARGLELSDEIGIPAGYLGALSPLRHWAELTGFWDATLSALALMSITAWTFHQRVSRSKHLRAVLVGATWGLLALLQPATVMVFAVLLVLLSSQSRDVRGLILAVVSFLVILTPWTIRNYRTFGGLMFVRGNLGVELSVSNNDGALPSHENVLRNPLARHPHVDMVEFAQRSQIGELRYDRARLADAVAWITGHPTDFARLSVQRFRLFWLPQRSHAALTVTEWALAALACRGLWLLFKRRLPARWVILGTWLLYPALYYFIQADERYRYPIEWSIVLAAAVSFDRIKQLFIKPA
jgi:hypothetical protein